MEKFAFRTFMDNDVVQKTIIFADAFNLYIDGWRPANTPEHPYRIYFYNHGMVVGYIDGETYNFFGDIKTEMPFVLFTPFGKITGFFHTHEELFKYSIENRKDAFEKIKGLFEVKDYNEKQSGKYHIASSLDLIDLDNHRIEVRFNRMAGSYSVSITKTGPGIHETVRLYDNSQYLRIEHFNYPEHNKKQELANIKLDFESQQNTVPASFEFSGNNVYQKVIELEREVDWVPHWEKLDLIDLSIIYEEIAKNDPSMLTFIDEIKASLTLPANGITPISVYNRFAGLCFHEPNSKYKLDFTRAEEVKVALDNNPVLQRMKQNKK